MPTIRKLQSGRYNCQVRCKGIKTQSKTFDTYAEAHSWGEQREAGLINTKSVTENVTTFKDMGLRYAATILKGRPSQNEFRMRVERMAPHFKQQPGEDWIVPISTTVGIKTVSNLM